MKNIKVVVILTIVCIMVLVILTNSYAAEGDTFELQLIASTSTLNPGDDFTVNLTLDNIKVTGGDQGIGAYQTKILYDTDILELVSIAPASGWEVSQNEGNIIANTSNGQVVKQKTNTAIINFKVKDNVTSDNTTISLESVSGSSGETIIGKGVSAKINITGKQEENKPSEDNQTENENTVSGNNQAGNNNSTDTNNQTGTNNIVGGNNLITNNIPVKNNTIINCSNIDKTTTANKSLPKTGFTNIIVLAIVILSIVSIVSLIKYKALKLK